MRTFRVLFLTAMAAAFASGCAGHLGPTFDVSVSSRRSVSALKATTFFVDARARKSDPAVAAKAVNIIEAALKRRGMSPAPADRADLVVSLEYSLSAPREVREWQSEAVYRTRQTSPTTQTVQVGSRPDGSPIYQTITTPGEMTQDYIGERQVCVTSNIHDKRFRAIATLRGGTRERWGIEVISTDEGTDLARYVPVLAAAAAEYIDIDTPAALALKVDGHGRAVNRPAIAAPSRAGTQSATRCG